LGVAAVVFLVLAFMRPKQARQPSLNVDAQLFPQTHNYFQPQAPVQVPSGRKVAQMEAAEVLNSYFVAKKEEEFQKGVLADFQRFIEKDLVQ
jgi:hypothetical protein